MQADAVDLKVSEGIAHIRLVQPNRGNPFDDVFAVQFRQAAETIATRNDVRAVTILAEGKHFSFGGDLRRLAKDRDALPTFGKLLLSNLVVAFEILAEINAPVIAGVQGSIAGGAVGLVAGCDLVFASPSARFVPAFTEIGLCPDSGSSYHLPRKVGLGRAQAFYFLGEVWAIDAALAHGLVSKIVPIEELVSSTLAAAQRLADGPTLALGETKRLLNRNSNDLSEHLAREADAIGRLLPTDDAWEGITALLQKRRPTFGQN